MTTNALTSPTALAAIVGETGRAGRPQPGDALGQSADNPRREALAPGESNLCREIEARASCQVGTRPATWTTRVGEGGKMASRLWCVAGAIAPNLSHA